ncbi:MAG: thiamine-phosphate kinase [Desulfobacteraceae bacterium]|nr:thiamine-phosphate kinase [Desulfobacteraceae bacterium]
MDNGKIDLRFYFITDDSAPAELSALRQAEIAVAAGATAVQYRNKKFFPSDFAEFLAIRDLCVLNGVCFIVNDDIVLARAAGADGVHLGQQDADAVLARNILGETAVIGISVSTIEELARTDLSCCDYIGTGPVCNTGTKADAKPVIGVKGLAEVVSRTTLPVVAIGGINAWHVSDCFEAGATGVAVISAITRAADPEAAAEEFGAACGLEPRAFAASWIDEFSLIRRIVAYSNTDSDESGAVRIGAGDDAALLGDLKNPVFTTDTQREYVHFCRGWLSMEDLGYKAAEITFSDLAASYAEPVALFVNLALPKDVSEEHVLQIYEGIGRSLAKRKAVLAGGNISSARVLGLDLFAAGEANPDIFPVRSAAKPGWGVYVTGPLGLARAGLDCLKRGDDGFAGLIRAFTRPAARFDAPYVLAQNRVECAMDISDGLAGDAAHIAEASGVTVDLDFSAAPVAPELAKYCEKYGWAPVHVMASGGEDYELLFACPPDVFESVCSQLPSAFQVGVCRSYTGKLISGLPEDIHGYRHGKGRF